MKIKIHNYGFSASILRLAAVFLAISVSNVGAAEYDPTTVAYIDALWFRAHAANCPTLILKEYKETMTLAEADLAGARIGESGQSGRTDCCFIGYQRQHPQAVIEEDAMGVVQLMKSGRHKYHVHGCHRFTPDQQDQRMTLANARGESGFYLCEHCKERGPGFAQMSQEEWDKLPSNASWIPPEGWAPSSFAANTLPPQDEIVILLSETLHGDIAIQESVYINPIATVDNFMIMRFFFPVHRWLELYQAYRCSGDEDIFEQLRGSARHYNTLSKNYLSAAQKKAKDPEGLAYMYTMAASARITLQLARKYPGQVTADELEEAEDFLMTIISVLQPICEANDNLDPSMGIPRPLADDFRNRAFNRAMNGIGTIGMATAALQDLQTLNGTTTYQSTIDRYRKVIQEYIKNWKNTGFEETVDGKDYFSYPYSASDNGYMVGDVKLFGADDQGHFSHTMQGAYVLYESVPELGIDDAFMTAIANTIYFNSYTETSGSPQTPSQEAIQPKSRHPYGAARERFYMLEAFKDGVIEGQCYTLSASETELKNSEYAKRLATLNAHYLKALRQDRSLIHLAEKDSTSPAAPTGLATTTAGDSSVDLDWDDYGENDLYSYNVYRSTNSGSYGTALVTGLSSSQYSDSSAASNTTYYYVVTATDMNSNESAQSAEVSATLNEFSGTLITFGSESDGLGEFTQSTTTANQIWSMQPESVQYRNQSNNMQNASLLREFPLNRGDGNAYTIEGVLYLTDGYASDNARAGIYLFGDSAVVPDEDETGALSLLFNLGRGAVNLMEGIDKNTISRSDTGRSMDDSIFGNTVKFTAKITFSGSDIQVAGTFTDEFDASTTVNATVPAANYTGDYFGFVTRTRSRNYGVSGDPKSAPFVVDYESFCLSRDDEPLTGYRQWANDWGIGKDAPEFGDHDGDGVSNFVEFGLGGNPDDPSDQGMLPTFSRSGNSALFVYPKRNDTEEIIYTVETSTTLSPDSWAATRYTIGDTDFGDGAHDFITIHVETDEPSLFIRLRIERRPAE